MGLFITVLITLAVLGSIMWVMPSPREKRIIAMRRRAMAEGLKVRLVDQAFAQTHLPWLEDYRRYVLYELFYQQDRKKQPQTRETLRLSEGFEAHELDQGHGFLSELQKKGLLQDLPTTSEALVCYPGAVGLVWAESEGEEAVARVKHLLDKVAKAWQQRCALTAKR